MADVIVGGTRDSTFYTTWQWSAEAGFSPTVPQGDDRAFGMAVNTAGTVIVHTVGAMIKARDMQDTLLWTYSHGATVQDVKWSPFDSTWVGCGNSASLNTVFKVDADGVQVWKAPGNATTAFTKVDADPVDGSILCTGKRANNLTTFKYDKDGVLLWSRDHGGSLWNNHIDPVTGASFGVGQAVSSVNVRGYDRDGNQLLTLYRSAQAYDLIVNPTNGRLAVAGSQDATFGLEVYDASGVSLVDGGNVNVIYNRVFLESDQTFLACADYEWGVGALVQRYDWDLNLLGTWVTDRGARVLAGHRLSNGSLLYTTGSRLASINLERRSAPHGVADRVWGITGASTGVAYFVGMADAGGSVVSTVKNGSGASLFRHDSTTGAELARANTWTGFPEKVAVDVARNAVFVVGSRVGAKTLTKYDSDFNEVWNRDHGANCFGVAVDLVDGSVVIGGWATPGVSIRKYDTAGTLLWSANTGAAVWEVAIDPFDQSVITGGSAVASASLCKYDKDGNQLWTANHSDDVRGIAVDPEDQSIYMVGDRHGSTCIRKFDKNGNQLWFADHGNALFSVVLDVAADEVIGIGGVNNGRVGRVWTRAGVYLREVHGDVGGSAKYAAVLPSEGGGGGGEGEAPNNNSPLMWSTF